MTDWMNWLVIAGIMVALELFTGTFYLLMIALGLLAGALAAFLGWTAEFQVIAAAVVGLIGAISLRCSRFGRANKIGANRDSNVNLDIGQPIQINEWEKSSNGVYSSRAKHRGAMWDVQYGGKGEPVPGAYEIVEIQGSQLIVDSGKP